MLLLNISDIKGFMSLLFKSEALDGFEVRGLTLKTFTTINISGELCKAYFPLDERECISRGNCLWGELRSFIFEFIKGKRSPVSMKLILSPDRGRAARIYEKASALFLNVNYENQRLTCVTGIALKEFTLDKTAEYQWDEYVSEFFKEKGVS